MNKTIKFYRKNEYPDIQAVVSKKFYHGVLTVNLGIFDFGILTSFATEKEGVLFSEVIGTKSCDLDLKGSFDNFEYIDKEKGSNYKYECAYTSLSVEQVSGNIEIMKEHVEDFEGLSHRFEDGSEIHVFLTKGESPEFNLYVLISDPQSHQAVIGESSLKLTYEFK